ncbi:YiaA/YiaB family inner membrane protein [Hahella ganghwensis]|uniref:YiaA/YiaB family inner membrane protein n=1 Tax=Hahella ganghwensis TaxID=286420 RepID=UPI00037C6379|nr:YiaA/YiaB family inner membrane protein [Hahella ganghwensis]
MSIDELQSNSKGWLFYVKASFVVALVAVGAGIFLMPTDLLVKGYFGISTLFLVSSTITLSKTMRDEHEAQRLLHRLSEAKTNQILREYAD